jgi:AsmA protein
VPKAVKIVAFLAGGLLALLVAFGVVLTLVFDPNDYKEQIVAAVKNHTGRTLQIEGKLGWSFFPWIGIETGRLALGNAPGFGPEPFARIDAAGAKVELLPLLRKKIVVDTALLDGLQLRLARNAAGRTNWDDLIGPAQGEKPDAPDGAGAGLGVLVNGIDVRRAEIVWDDQAGGARYALRNLDLKTGKIAGAEPMKLRLAFDLESGRPVVRTRVELTSTLRADLDAQTLETSDVALGVGELKLRSQLKVTRLLDAPTVQGQLDIAPFNLRALLATLNVPYAPADKKALERLAVKSAFSGNAEGVEFKNLVLGLDDSRLTGTLAVTRFAKPVFRFDLALDWLDVDRYLPAAAPAAAAWPGIGVAVAAVPADDMLGTLRALTLNGRLRIGQLTAMKLRFSDAAVQVAAAGGLIRLGPNQAGFYGGRYRGQTTLDARGRQALLTLDDTLSGAQLTPALKDALQFDKFAGTADVNAKLSAQGLDARQIKQTLSGNASLSIRDGTIKGLDLKKMIDTLEAARRERRLEKLAELKPGANDETRFTHLSGTAAITHGVARNDDLKIQSPGVAHVGGKGTIDLARETLDYTVTAGSYPIHIAGPFANLRFRPDMRGVVEQRLKEEESKAKERLEQKLKKRFKLP